MTAVRALWDDAKPEHWRRAATDWRGMQLDAMSGRMSRHEAADEVGLKGVSKVGELIAEWRQLEAGARDGLPDAVERVRRAEDFGRMIASRRAAGRE